MININLDQYRISKKDYYGIVDCQTYYETLHSSLNFEIYYSMRYKISKELFGELIKFLHNHEYEKLSILYYRRRATNIHYPDQDYYHGAIAFKDLQAFTLTKLFIDSLI